MRKTVFIVLLSLFAVLISACGASGGDSNAVTLTSPVNTSVIYASSVYIAGTANGTGDLLVQLILPDETVLTETRINNPDGEFSTEVIHGYDGDPSEVLVRVLPADTDTTEEPTLLAESSILLASIENRPEGAFADVLSPQPGDNVGGDRVEVFGRASGIENREFTVELMSSNGDVIDTQTVTLSSPYAIDDVPWRTELSLNEFTGSALIKVNFSDELQVDVPVDISSAAG